MVKIIKTDAVEPQPVRKEAMRSEVVEIFVFDQHDRFIGSEYRLLPEVEEVNPE